MTINIIRRDVLVIGAGLAGSAAAAVLARSGLAVTVIDPNAVFPPLFRAEKIEPDQAALLQSQKLEALGQVEDRAPLHQRGESMFRAQRARPLRGGVRSPGRRDAAADNALACIGLKPVDPGRLVRQALPDRQQ